MKNVRFELSREYGTILLIVMAPMLAWFLSATLYNVPGPEWLSKIMGKPDGPEDIFAPIAALFSGIAAFATVYLLYLQMTQIRENSQENHILKLIDIHANEVRNLKYHDGIKAAAGGTPRAPFGPPAPAPRGTPRNTAGWGRTGGAVCAPRVA